MTAAATEPGRTEATLDDRVATRSLAVRMLRRPEVGSLVGAATSSREDTSTTRGVTW
ncbi:hypothetical protein [Nonomuraea turcica]|uniref:hypothetical protein n=1 Tax=Nonomuraea sp. G32 TaxID=3067274 RepID=UPI00273A9283|nr:hypothetical protein [Nonomuraea sp. G32]MDP4509304.1 hypothetical protein [Nonomuraea sp. G32]